MATKNFKNIKIEKDKGANKGITWLILNRPEKRNAMSPELHFEMSEALDILAEDDDTQILVLTGAGLSTASGIPDYRDADAATQERLREELGTPDDPATLDPESDDMIWKAYVNL